MSRHTRPSPRRPSGGERVFTDEQGRLWSASYARADAAVVFTCISDSRQSIRAIAIDPTMHLADAADDLLRAWLQNAPRIGRLT